MSLLRIVVLFHLLSASVATLPTICTQWPGQHNTSANGIPVITYALCRTDVIDYIDRTKLMAVLEESFDEWARIIRFAFEATDDYDEADVKVGFFVGDDGDGYVFRRDSSTVAYSDLLFDVGYVVRLNGYVHWSVFFLEEPWLSQPYDLETVFENEIGKVLGLGNSKDEKSVMSSSIDAWTKQYITREDAMQAQALCGANPNFDIDTLPSSSASSAPSTIGMSILAVMAAIMSMIML